MIPTYPCRAPIPSKLGQTCLSRHGSSDLTSQGSAIILRRTSKSDRRGPTGRSTMTAQVVMNGPTTTAIQVPYKTAIHDAGALVNITIYIRYLVSNLAPAAPPTAGAINP